jgi:hypothetical protein
MFPLVIELVVILSPSLNLGESLMKPVIEESPFFFHRTRDGTPRGADLMVLLRLRFLTGAGLDFGADVTLGIAAPFGAR